MDTEMVPAACQFQNDPFRSLMAWISPGRKMLLKTCGHLHLNSVGFTLAVGFEASLALSHTRGLSELTHFIQ